MSGARCDRFVLGALAGVAAFGAGAHACLAARLAVPDVLLPLALAIALAWPWRTATWSTAVPAPRWLAGALAALFAAAVVAVAYGALATPSRTWDGAVAWDATARFLVERPTLEQPYFRDAAVYAHSRDYPMLQPLLLAGVERWCGHGAGRAVFVAIYLLLAAVLGGTLRSAGVRAGLAGIGTVAAMLTPMLLGPGNGSIDSGYGDAFLALATTTLAAGLLRRDAQWLAVGALLAVFGKPEGLVYAGAATAIAFVTGERRLVLATAAAWLGAAACWLPVQRGLLHPDVVPDGATFALAAAIAAAAFAAIAAADAVARRRGLGARGRALAVAVAAPVLLLAVGVGASRVAGGGALHHYFADPGRALARLGLLPEIAAGLLQYALLRGPFGALFWLALVALPWARRRGLAPLAAFLGAGVLVVLVPFVLGNGQELAHHLRSSMPRLLLHWFGAAALFGVAAVAAAGAESAEPERDGDAAPEPQR